MKTGCKSTQHKVILTVDPDTQSHLISEVDNNIYGPNGMVDLNLFYDKNSRELGLKFHYRDQDWLFIEQQESFMFLFDDGYIVSLSPSGEIHTNVIEGDPPDIIEEWGQVPWTGVMIEKVLQEKLIGVRINGNIRYKEYDQGIAELQRKWKKMLSEYPEMIEHRL